MGFIEMPLEDAVSKEVVPEGTYELVIEDAQPPKEGKTSVMVRLSVVDEPNAKSIFHHIGLIQSDDDEEKRNYKLIFANAFLDAFSIPHEGSGFNTDDMFGATGKVHLTQEEYNGIVSNRIQLST